MHPLNPNTIDLRETAAHCYCCDQAVSIYSEWMGGEDAGFEVIECEDEWREIDGEVWCAGCVEAVAGEFGCDVETVLCGC